MALVAAGAEAESYDYAVVIDAGSTGSRARAFRWPVVAGAGGGSRRNASAAAALCPARLHRQLVTEVFVPAAAAAAAAAAGELPNRVRPGLGSLVGRTAAEVAA